MWRKTRTSTLEWHGMTTALKIEQIEGARESLETKLLNAGWQTLRPRWLERRETLFEFKDHRILTDNSGVFMYQRQRIDDSFDGKPLFLWRRFAGYAGFDKAIIAQGVQGGVKTFNGDIPMFRQE